MSYQMYEMAHLALMPARLVSDATCAWFKNPLNPASYTPFGRNLAASAELFERMTRRYGKPVFGFTQTTVEGREVAVQEETVWQRPFCRLVRFRRDGLEGRLPQAKLLIVAPMSGHYATLLRGTAEAFLPFYDVYITDWSDARMVPQAAGRFDLDDYIDDLMAMCRALGERSPATPVHTLGVCQPAVPLLAAVARMEAERDPLAPASMTLMGGPIDTRRAPTAVNKLAQERGTEWFRENCLRTVPLPYPGAGRSVYPGFLQLSGFMAMNMDRHVTAHTDMFNYLVQGDGDSAEKHREFYDEYLAVMDLTAEFYMQTIETVFVRQSLAKGEMTHRGAPVDPGAIRNVGLLTIEGERDDISGLGQTEAAQDLCANIPAAMKRHHVQMGVGHYGVFNGSRFRAGVVPLIVDFTRGIDARRAPDRLAG
ncbi:polyhydroxyalkanoate depolymerase [Lichenihabitans sp. Uapishka_5]|uniref:polyhydroxyalkanoate depolymerase n=1 Tax=Lichenihabitans sp. Uapishka_5 TaxID=3037302 RepID=UPI0029E820D4|nr:polyhydroxyalkanoate depolymerase [Lichenihabitans sp. Uapishka_5]MDX7951492.1 polyhydroxyalkanoate depolymerase [Lichenihabitans sp. Uapishka_5]